MINMERVTELMACHTTDYLETLARRAGLEGDATEWTKQQFAEFIADQEARAGEKPAKGIPTSCPPELEEEAWEQLINGTPHPDPVVNASVSASYQRMREDPIQSRMILDAWWKGRLRGIARMRAITGPHWQGGVHINSGPSED